MSGIKTPAMRYILLLLSAASLLLSSCEKDSATAIKDSATATTIPNGTYTGTFIRTSPNAKYAPSKVTLTINGNRFTGTSEISNYPAICSGTFKVEGAKLHVTNECMFTADFDWTYIFNQQYDIEVSGNELRISRDYGGGTFDRYVFVKQ
jgi:hypothetical protein